ncbi:MAG: hypothetical protein WCK01_00375 [Candidatus Uhrbacteria bacterium]
MNRNTLAVALLAIALLLVAGCGHEDSPAVVQARAAVVLAESDLRTAQAALAGAEAQARQAQAAAVAAEREPQLVAAVAAYSQLSAAQQARWDERRRWEAERGLDSAGHFLNRPQLDRIDNELSQNGGQVVRAQNAMRRLQGPVLGARNAAIAANTEASRARGEVRNREAAVARARQVLEATVTAAR